MHGGTERYGLPSFAGENHLQFDFACYLEASVSLDLFEPDFVLCVKVMVDDMMHEFIFVHKETDNKASGESAVRQIQTRICQ